VEACAARIRWRLRPQSKRRLLNDITFLCTGLRPVILMDYGGTMPQLQENLCSLLHHARQEASILNPLRVMVMKDMLYLIHAEGLAEHVSPNARSQHQLAFVDLEKSCCELLANTEKNETMVELLSIQDRFAATFPLEADVEPETTQQKSRLPERATDVERTGISIPDTTSLVVDLSAFLEGTQMALPSLNGWLLGYPVTYLFRNESGETATQNLSKHSLHIYRIYVVRFGLFHEYASCRYSRKNFLLALILVISYCRNRHSDSKQSEEELLSFSVPCDISMKREEEPWAKSFLARVNGKLERCSQVWASVRLEIEVFQSQSGVIVL
uniref:Uncharacterized protein n=6 Tax=Aegilops tauschii subsp. strangulata TaxID=200361 RepID=A0A453LBL7_AEGTS